MNGQLGPGPALRPNLSQNSMARHPSREQLIDYLMLKVSQQPGQPGPHGPPRMPQEALQEVSPVPYGEGVLEPPPRGSTGLAVEVGWTDPCWVLLVGACGVHCFEVLP